MRKDKFKKIIQYVISNIFVFSWIFIISAVLVGVLSHKVIKYTESPEFCVKCHSMKEQYETWSHSLHRNFKCVDCHLPNDNFVNHYVWKGIDGTKDLISETMGLKEWWEIHLSEHGKKVLQSNCIRCHEGIVSHIDKKRNCIDCHKTVTHKNTALTCSFNTNDKK